MTRLVSEGDGEPYHPIDHSESHDSWNEVLGYAICYILNWCFGVLCVLNHLHNLIKCGIFRHFVNLKDYGSLGEQRTTINALPHRLALRSRLPRKHRFICAPLTEDNEAISGNGLALVHDDEVTEFEELHLNFSKLTLEIYFV